ncbi:hypothetical protein [Nocardia arthritidis]|uniref:hypothetical protein n=1 Tax=Nocardia arthritidis TaxID=228602 RepID=UPI00157D016B|nr:hypothetical protein [Nocardia arthritidis]
MPHEAGMASGVFNSARQLGGCVGVAALATIAATRTGNSTAPAALNDGYALALCCAAGLFALASIVAATVLPATRRTIRTTRRGRRPRNSPPRAPEDASSGSMDTSTAARYLETEEPKTIPTHHIERDTT